MTELLWEGKYRDGKRALPDRTPRTLRDDELVDPPGAEPAATEGRESGSRNRLIHGDTRAVLPSLLHELSGCVNLVYIDPPFATGADQTIAIPLPRADSESTATPPSSVERVAYRDTWGRGPGPRLDGYLHWFFETATLLRDLLAEDGAIIVHCDWRTDAPLRLILDEVFGAGNFRNAIAWAYRSGGASRRESLARKHDTLLLYARSPRFAIRPQIERQYLRKPFMGSKRDAAGRHYVDTLLRDVLDGELTLVRDGQLVRRGLRPVLNVSRERLGYPTQKPLGLLELLIESATDPGDLVLDCCCGSGTTPAAAALTGRRWIAADSSPFALTATRARLLALPAARPFVVQRVVVADDKAARAAGGNAGTLHVSVHVTREGPSPPSPLSLRGEGEAERKPDDAAGMHGARPPLRGDGVATNAVAARPASPSLAARRDAGGKEHPAYGSGESRQATAGGTCPAPTTDDEPLSPSSELPSSTLCASPPLSPPVSSAVSPSALSSVSSVASVPSVVNPSSSRPLRSSVASTLCVTLTVKGLTLPLRDLPAGVVAPDARSGCAWIASWLVDWEHDGAVFRVGDWSGRPRGGAAPPAALTHTYTSPGQHTIAVRAIDLLGGVTTKTLDVDL